jgi:hypothetical protein
MRLVVTAGRSVEPHIVEPREVLGLIADGLTNTEVANRLYRTLDH